MTQPVRFLDLLDCAGTETLFTYTEDGVETACVVDQVEDPHLVWLSPLEEGGEFAVDVFDLDRLAYRDYFQDGDVVHGPTGHFQRLGEDDWEDEAGSKHRWDDLGQPLVLVVRQGALNVNRWQ